jgi:hypothetical protein
VHWPERAFVPSSGLDAVNEQQFPFIADILEEKAATLYVLCDDPLRTRDPLAALTLTRFFTARDVRLDVVPVLAEHRRYISPRDMATALKDPDLTKQAETVWASATSIEEKVSGLFNLVEAERRRCHRCHPSRVTKLAPRG